MFDLDLNLDLDNDVLKNVVELSSKEIAIIGVCARLPLADNAEDFWKNLIDGVDCIREVPYSRRADIENYLKCVNELDSSIEYTSGAYLNNIDRFDYEFFKISAKEAGLMDPNQRIFLEAAWKTLEDAGYGGDKLVGSRTGVYVGFTARGEYQSLISRLEPESMIIAEAGNLSSIIPSRISYMMDFRGPSILVDTACSSSLVAAHLACQAIRNGECDQAIAGGIKISLLPVETREKLGIESGSGKVRTFDDDSDGTLFGEGCLVILLKPLSKAVKDRDNIYAVIKGSAINQDGASVGITAPNVLAQEDVIIKAWKDAGIDPETISYIEAHGTGTKLGDPIEVNGIKKAFRQYTTKKQFCAIGSVKTNIGHLDNASGLAGLLKAVLALKHKKLPPTLNFQYPNRKINFEESPVYVNSRTAEWEVEAGPRRCGVSSFGLSGTNCHIVLEEAEQYVNEPEQKKDFYIFTISAKQKRICEKLVKEFRQYIEVSKQLALGDICYTASTGRGHYNYRVAVIARDTDDLLQKLINMCEHGIYHSPQDGIYFGEHKIASDNKENLVSGEIRESRKKELSHEVNEVIKRLAHIDEEFSQHSLMQICEMYVTGASVNWESLYARGQYRRVSLPSYPFDEKRCWLDIPQGRVMVNPVNNRTGSIPLYHPLLDRCIVESITQDIYITNFNVDKHWVLNEHRIMGSCLVPGTVYLEMARECAKRYLPGDSIEFRDVIFIAPLIVADGETREVQTIINKNAEYIEFTVAARTESGKTEESWVRFCEGKVYPNEVGYNHTVDLQKIKQRCTSRVDKASRGEMGGNQANFNFGPRWTSLMHEMYIGDDEVLAELILPEKFAGDLEEYYLHPSLLDIAVNAVTQTTGYGMYLPLSYGSFKIYNPTSERFFSYIRKRSDDSGSLETISFDISLFDSHGKLIGEANGFSIKKVHEGNFKHNQAVNNDIGIYTMNYIPLEQNDSSYCLSGEHILVIKEDNDACSQLMQCLKNSGRTRIIEVTIGKSYKRCSETQYIVNGTEEDYKVLFSDINGIQIKQILHTLTAFCSKEADSLEDMEVYQNKGVYSLVDIAKCATTCGFSENIDLVVITDKVYDVSDGQTGINPYNAPLVGIGKVINREFSGLKCRCIDIDEFTDRFIIASEINHGFSTYYTAFRNGKRYVEELVEIELQDNGNISTNIREDGVYIITGGMGGLGVEITKCIAQIKKANIALIGRKKSLEDYGTKHSDRIEAIKEIEGWGSSVLYYSADVADIIAMSEILNELKTRFGRINGIIHTAGVAGDGYIINRTRDKFNEIMSPKVYGTWVLHTLTYNEDMDFFINFSSISSLYGGLGQGDYTAANSYLDAFAAFRSRKGRKTLTINWAAWKETGMAHDFGIGDDGIFKMLSINDAISAFRRVLGGGDDRVIIGGLDINLLSSYSEGLPIKLSDKIQAKVERKMNRIKAMKKTSLVGEKHLKVRIRGKEGQEYNSTEVALAGAWAVVLGMEEIDIYDSFNDLGGDSILATRLLKEIDKVFPGMIDISNIFAYPTINEMAIFIESKGKPKKETNKNSVGSIPHNNIDDLLEQVENGRISIDDADRLLMQCLGV